MARKVSDMLINDKHGFRSIVIPSVVKGKCPRGNYDVLVIGPGGVRLRDTRCKTLKVAKIIARKSLSAYAAKKSRRAKRRK